MTQRPVTNHQQGGMTALDYTPSAAVAMGQVAIRGGKVTIATAPLVASVLGVTWMGGVWRVPKIQGALSDGDDAYWNPSAQPVNWGTADGACQAAGTAYFMGMVIGDAAADDEFCYVLTRVVVNIATLGGAITAVTSITGSDSSLDIAGTPGSTSAGGAIALTGGAGDGAGFAGGAVPATGGAGYAHTTGTGGAGGAATRTGGAGGTATTGTGGAGGDVGGTSGAGGAASGALGVGGASGAATFTVAAGGSCTTGTGGAGGAAGFIGGAGGACTTGTGGAGTDLTFTAGNGGTTSGAGVSGRGGNVTFTAGSSSAGGGTAGKVGHIAFEGLVVQSQGAPTALTTNATMTIAQLQTKLLTGTHAVGATQTYILPTGTLMSGGNQLSVGDSFDWTLINLSANAADTVTVAAGVDHTVVGVMVVQSVHGTTGGITGNCGTFRSRKTGATTWITYRIA